MSTNDSGELGVGKPSKEIKSGVVDFADAAEYLAKRTTTMCPACGYDKWNVYATDGVVNNLHSTGLVGISLPSKRIIPIGIPMVTATCKRCSFVRLHNADAIAEWVVQGKPEFDDGQ